MSKQISITLDDEQQVVLEEILKLQAKHLKGAVATERRIIASAIATGLRRDLGTLRRFAGLAERLQG